MSGDFFFGVFVGFMLAVAVLAFIVGGRDSAVKLYPYGDQTCVVQQQEILRCYPTEAR